MKSFDRTPRATSQRQRAAEPDAQHQGGSAEGRVGNSPRMAAQRQQLAAAFGPTAQRAGPEEELQMKANPALQRVEEEEPLQGRFAPVQRVEEEELLQGRFAPVQRVEEEELLQGKFAPVQRAEEEEPLQGRFDPAASGAAPGSAAPASAAPNRTGMPDGLKSGIESISGLDLSDVRVHGDSSQPAQLGALAFAQGNDIHLAPGQEQHLPHEAWHVVQQRQGRVQPTLQMGGVAVNDDAGLEAEADAMGAKALQAQRPGRG